MVWWYKVVSLLKKIWFLWFFKCNHGMRQYYCCWFRPRFPTEPVPKSHLLSAVFGHLKPQKPKTLLSRVCMNYSKKIIFIHDRRAYFVNNIVCSYKVHISESHETFLKNTSQAIITAWKPNSDFVKIKQTYFWKLKDSHRHREEL